MDYNDLLVLAQPFLDTSREEVETLSKQLAFRFDEATPDEFMKELWKGSGFDELEASLEAQRTRLDMLESLVMDHDDVLARKILTELIIKYWDTPMRRIFAREKGINETYRETKPVRISKIRKAQEAAKLAQQAAYRANVDAVCEGISFEEVKK